MIGLIGPCITSCLNSFIKSFRENPFDFLFKAEIQAVLYSSLRSQIKEMVRLPGGIFRERTGHEWIRTGIVRAGYPPLEKFDIAILHPAENGTKKPNQEGNPLDNLELMGAIAMELHQMRDQFWKKLNSFLWNMDRLYGFRNDHRTSTFAFGLSLLFSQEGNDLRGWMAQKSFKIKEVQEIEEVSGIHGYLIGHEATYRVDKSTVTMEEVKQIFDRTVPRKLRRIDGVKDHDLK